MTTGPAAPAFPFAEHLAPLETSHFWFVGRDELVEQLLARCRAATPILDVGGGTGTFAARLARHHDRVLVVDRTHVGFDGAAVAGARADAERLPLRSGSVGTVLARDLLEHVDDRAALVEARRVLRPGGLLVALVPAWPALWSWRDERAGHRRRYTRATLRRALAAAGFDVQELRGYQLVLLPLALASRAAARRRPGDVLLAEEHPPAALNRLLTRINRGEARLARVSWPRPPTGSTLVAVARRP